MPDLTNKELLNAIAKKQLQTAAQLSSFINKQEGINEKLLGYLENNDKTNQVGVVQKQQELNSRVETLETHKKIIVGVSAALFSFFAWIISLIK
jgi:hypothetical protein